MDFTEERVNEIPERKEKDETPEKKNRFLSYWKESVADFTNVKKLAFASLMMAMSVALQAFKIPVDATGALFVQLTFWISALSGVVCGPLLSLLRGAAADVIGFFVFPSGFPFFFGYTLSAALGSMVYSLLFWKRKVSFTSIFLAKLTVNIFINAGLGALWSSMLYGTRGYFVYFGVSLAKNLVMLPIEVTALVLLFRAIMPIMASMKMIEKRQIAPLVTHVVFLVVFLVVSITLSVLMYVYGAEIASLVKDFLYKK